MTDDVQEDTQDQQVTDESAVSDESTPDTDVAMVSDDEGGHTVLLNLESMIKSHISGIATRKDELRKNREMLNDILVNDDQFRELEKTAKDAMKEKNARKSELMKQSNAIELSEKVRDLATEVKEMDEALSDYASEYQRISGSNQIELDNGEIHEIVYVARVIRKSGKSK